MDNACRRFDDRREKDGREGGAATPTEELRLLGQNCDRSMLGPTVTGDVASKGKLLLVVLVAKHIIDTVIVVNQSSNHQFSLSTLINSTGWYNATTLQARGASSNWKLET